MATTSQLISKKPVESKFVVRKPPLGNHNISTQRCVPILSILVLKHNKLVCPFKRLVILKMFFTFLTESEPCVALFHLTAPCHNSYTPDCTPTLVTSVSWACVDISCLRISASSAAAPSLAAADSRIATSASLLAMSSAAFSPGTGSTTTTGTAAAAAAAVAAAAADAAADPPLAETCGLEYVDLKDRDDSN